MKQYEMWWAELPQPTRKRSVLLLSRDDAREDCPSPAWRILISFGPFGELPAAKVGEVKRALGYALGWEELIEA